MYIHFKTSQTKTTIDQTKFMKKYFQALCSKLLGSVNRLLNNWRLWSIMVQQHCVAPLKGGKGGEQSHRL
jgi:hypothetical protein